MLSSTVALTRSCAATTSTMARKAASSSTIMGRGFWKIMIFSETPFLGCLSQKAAIPRYATTASIRTATGLCGSTMEVAARSRTTTCVTMPKVRGTSPPTVIRISYAPATRSDAIPITVAKAVRTPLSSHAPAHTIRRFACVGVQVRSAGLHTMAGNASRDRLAVRCSVASGLQDMMRMATRSSLRTNWCVRVASRYLRISWQMLCRDCYAIYEKVLMSKT